jgi:hypothetical protein
MSYKNWVEETMVSTTTDNGSYQSKLSGVFDTGKDENDDIDVPVMQISSLLHDPLSYKCI